MTRVESGDRRAVVRRAVAVGLLCAVVGAAVWFAADRYFAGEGGSAEVAVVGNDPSGAAPPQPSAPKPGEEPKPTELPGGDSAGEPGPAETPAPEPSKPEEEPELTEQPHQEDAGEPGPAETPAPEPPKPEEEPELTEQPHQEDAGEPGPAETPAPEPPKPDLGLDNIVREFILTRWWGETPRDEGRYIPSTHAKLESSDPETKRRGWFELEVRVELAAKLAVDPYYVQLQKSFEENFDLCLKEYGLPPLLELVQLPEKQQDALAQEAGIVGDRIREFEDKCWQQSRIYAGKDEETSRLLELQHQYYLEAAQDWVKANPDKVVPLPQ